jgi:hypothetical protein
LGQEVILIYSPRGEVLRTRFSSICGHLVTRTLATLISAHILLQSFKAMRKYEEIFVNYRAFGHSINDTNAFLISKEKLRLCISVGNARERNPYFRSIIPEGRLIQIILPKPRIIGRQNLRKAVGLKLFRYIYYTHKSGLLPKLQAVFHDNKAVVLESIREVALSKLDLSAGAVQKTVEQIYNLDLSAREHSKSVGTWAQIYNPEEFGIKSVENINDLVFKQELEKKGFEPNKLVTLILRVGGSPHHGPGLTHYEPIIEFLQSKNYLVLALGDTSSISLEFRSRFLNLALPSDFDAPVRSIDFSSIYYSRFTLGDMSGVWPIFTIRGQRGLCLNTIPTKFLMNRAEVLPRLWVDKKGMPMSLDRQFEMYGEIVRGKNREIEIEGYSPTFHTPETMLNCVKRFERELEVNQLLKIDEIYLKYFSEFPREMLRNCSIAPEFFEKFSKLSKN